MAASQCTLHRAAVGLLLRQRPKNRFNDGLWVGFVKIALCNTPDTHQLFLSRAQRVGRGLCELLLSKLLLRSHVRPRRGWWYQAAPEHHPKVLHCGLAGNDRELGD